MPATITRADDARLGSYKVKPMRDGSWAILDGEGEEIDAYGSRTDAIREACELAEYDANNEREEQLDDLTAAVVELVEGCRDEWLLASIKAMLADAR